MEDYQLIRVKSMDIAPACFEIAQKKANHYVTHSGMSYPESYVDTFGISEEMLNKIVNSKKIDIIY